MEPVGYTIMGVGGRRFDATTAAEAAQAVLDLLEEMTGVDVEDLDDAVDLDFDGVDQTLDRVARGTKKPTCIVLQVMANGPPSA